VAAGLRYVQCAVQWSARLRVAPDPTPTDQPQSEPQSQPPTPLTNPRPPTPTPPGRAAMFEFGELCDRPVAAADYIALSHKYHTVALGGVPAFGAANRSAAYRFVTLVDVLYENRWGGGKRLGGEVEGCL